MIDNLRFALADGGQVLLVALVLGAGLPALFALGVRALVPAGTDDRRPGTAPPAGPARRGLAVVCFALVLVAVVLGIGTVVATGFGRSVSFEHGYPTVEPA